MKPKQNTSEKQAIEIQSEGDITTKRELSIAEQLEIFADIIIDIYLKTEYENANQITD